MEQNSSSSDYIQLDIPAHYQFLNVLGATLNAMLERIDGIEERDKVSYSMELALHETCTNIVEHAYGGKGGRIQVRITLERQPRQMVLDVHDNGQVLDLATIPEPDLKQVQTRGYGLFLVRKLVDEVAYQRSEDSNWWRLVKRI